MNPKIKFYTNNRTRVEVEVLEIIEPDTVKIRYRYSGKISYYHIPEFDKKFTRVPKPGSLPQERYEHKIEYTIVVIVDVDKVKELVQLEYEMSNYRIWRTYEYFKANFRVI